MVNETMSGQCGYDASCDQDPCDQRLLAAVITNKEAAVTLGHKTLRTLMKRSSLW